MSVRLIVQADLVMKFGQQRILQLCDENDDGMILGWSDDSGGTGDGGDEGATAAAGTDAEIVDKGILVASAHCYAALHRGFTAAQITLLGADEFIKDCVCSLWMGWAMRRKPEFASADGTFPYPDKLTEGSKKDLQAIVETLLEPETETTAGSSALEGGSIRKQDPPFVFAPSGTGTSRVYPGGY